jgi:hypothetical protein
MSLPSLSPTSCGFVESMTLAQATRLLASCSETTRFAVLVNRIDDPVDTGIPANGLVLRIDQDNLKVLICGDFRDRWYLSWFTPWLVGFPVKITYQ